MNEGDEEVINYVTTVDDVLWVLSNLNPKILFLEFL